MQERLVVKHFGPVKNIDLPIKQVNVLIGEQGTGKSTIAKLIAIFKSIEFISDHKNGREIFRSFRIDSYIQSTTIINFKSENYSVQIKNGKITLRANKSLKSFLNRYSLLSKRIVDSKNSSNLTELLKERSEVAIKINGLAGIYSYIPAERLINSLIAESFFSIDSSKLTLPKYITDFGVSFTQAKKSRKSYSLPFGGYKFIHDGENDLLQLNELKSIKYLEGSSGFLSVIPLLLVIAEQSSSDKYHGIFLVEEPELNLFPKTQNEVLKEIVSSCLKFQDKLLLTTHSPYILTSLNNLMYSYALGQKEERKVNKILNKKYWLNPDDVSAFLLKVDGNSDNILNEEEGLIDASKIDEISLIINKQFDELIDIEIANENKVNK